MTDISVGRSCAKESVDAARAHWHHQKRAKINLSLHGGKANPFPTIGVNGGRRNLRATQ